MAMSIGFQQQRAAVLEPIVDQMVERALYHPELKIQNLLDRLFELNREPRVNEHEETRDFLRERIRQIDHRSPLEPLGREEQRFYNYCSGLVDSKIDRVDQFCLEKLKSIEFVDPLVADKEFEAYRVGVIRKQVFEKEIQTLREDVDSLGQKLTRYMTMTPLPMISIPATNGTHQIPEEIPIDATHLLLYIKIYSRQVSKPVSCDAIISNTVGGKYHFHYHLYGQNAVSYNSDNIWLEICSKRVLIIRDLKAPFISGEVGLQIFVTGYK